MSEEIELRPDLLRAGVPEPVADDSSVVDLTELAEPDDTPPSLLDDPSRLWPATSGLHSSLLSTSTSVGSAEAWQAMVEELAEESQHLEDDKLRGAMLCEAGRILIERLGRQEEGELLLRRSNSPVAEFLRRTLESGTTSLAAELARLESEAKDESQPERERVAAWIEFGQLCEERTPSRHRALEAYREALKLDPANPIARHLATWAAAHVGEIDAAQDDLREQLSSTKPSRHRVALLLALAELTDDPEERLIVLEQAHQAEPREETVLRRLTRQLSTHGDAEQLGELYHLLADVAEDPISASTSLHLAFLTLASAGHPVGELVAELSAHDPGTDSADVLAPLAEVALYVEARIAAGDDPRGLPENEGVLERLARCLDDPREQALVREQLARIRLQELRAEWSASGATTQERRVPEARAALADNLEADLRFCLVHLPEHRWVREALAEVLELRGNMPALVLHLQEWARTQSAGPGRAAILRRLGHVHEVRRRDLARAAEIYELAVAEDPDNPNCLRALGHVYEKMRRWPQAVASLRREAEESDDEPAKLAALRRVAALAEHELKDVDLAIAALEEVAVLDPDDLLSMYQLAKLCRSHRRPTVLITALERLVDRVDDDVARTALLVELGEVQELHLKRRPAARSCYERALSLTPGYTPALRALSRLYRDNGDLDELVGLLDPKIDTVTDPAVLALKAGRVCFEEIGDVDRAIEHLRRAYESNPDLMPARELLLQLLTASGRIKEAYDLLRAQDSPRSDALGADVSYRLGLLAEASARQQEGPPRRPSGPHPLEDHALQHYRAALGRQSDHGLSFERSRRLLIAHHDTSNLVRLIENLLTGGGDDAKAVHYVHLGRLHVAASDSTEEARRAYEEAMTSAPDDPVVRREFEALLRLLGDTTSLPALHLRAAAESKDTHLKATLLVEAAELLLSTGATEDHDLAGKAILEALQVDPGNPYAVRHLERLLSEPESPFAIKDAVSARAVRAQSDAERAIFYVESAELLERVGGFGQAREPTSRPRAPCPTSPRPSSGCSGRRARTVASVRRSTRGRPCTCWSPRRATPRCGRDGAMCRPRNKALAALGEILNRDPQHRDAIAVARTLAGQTGDPRPVIEMLSTAFARIQDRALMYELGLFLGEHAIALDDAVRYYAAANQARPRGRRALRGLVSAYRQMGDDRQAAAATEKLLELFEPGEPSAIDLRMGIANFLSTTPETLPRALDHARVVLEARPDDVRAIGLMADLLERAEQRPEAAGLLDRLAARERNRDRLHDVYLRKAKLLADSEGKEAEALEAIERAAALSPGNRDTITLLVEQLSRSGQTARIATYLSPIRSALIANIDRGAVSLRDLKLLAKVAAPTNPSLSQMSRDLLAALEPGQRRDTQTNIAMQAGLRRLLDNPGQRRGLLAKEEPPYLHTLLQAVDGVVARLPGEFPVAAATDTAPLPRDVDAAILRTHARRLADLIGVRAPRIAASASHNAAILVLEPICAIRLGSNLLRQPEPEAWRGLVAIAIARAALGAPRARALSPPDLDLLIAACFGVVDVFNPTTAEPDPRRLRDLVGNLRNVMPRRQRKAVETACQALASHPFDAGSTARATTGTDLQLAAIMSADLEGVLAAACLLDGVVGGTLKQRVSRSKLARTLMVSLISDELLAAADVARGKN